MVQSDWSQLRGLYQTFRGVLRRSIIDYAYTGLTRERKTAVYKKDLNNNNYS